MAVLWISPEMGNTRKTIPNSLSFPTTLFGYGIIKTVAAESFIRTANFSSQAYKEKSGNLPSDKVQFVLESAKGEVWIGTDKGLLKYQNGKTKQPRPATTELGTHHFL